MQVGDVLYRRIDSVQCILKGFFFLHEDHTQSLIYESLSYLKHLLYEIDKYKQLYVLFHADTFDTVENLYTNLYMTVEEYSKMREYIQSVENTSGLYSAFKLALDFPMLSTTDVTTSYKLGYVELEQESYEGQHAEEPYWREEDLVPNPR